MVYFFQRIDKIGKTSFPESKQPESLMIAERKPLSVGELQPHALFL